MEILQICDNYTLIWLNGQMFCKAILPRPQGKKGRKVRSNFGCCAIQIKKKLHLIQNKSILRAVVSPVMQKKTRKQISTTRCIMKFTFTIYLLGMIDDVTLLYRVGQT